MTNEELLAALNAKYSGNPVAAPSGGMTDDDLRKALSEKYGANPPASDVKPDRTWGDYAGMAGRAVAGGVADLADLAQMASPTGFAENIRRSVTGSPADPTLGEMVTSGLDAYGIAKPETANERVGSEILGALAGTKGLGAIGKAAKIPALAENMAGQYAAATAGSAASGTARENGVGAGGQIGLGLLAGAAPSGIAGLVRGTLGGNALTGIAYKASEMGEKVKPAIDEGMRLAEKYGVELTPAQISGGKSANMIENAARQSFFSNDKAFASDMKRADQYLSAIDRTMGKISKGSTLATGETLRANMKRAVDDLTAARQTAAAKDFGEVDNLAGGLGVVKPSRTVSMIDDLIEENSIAPEGSGQAAIAASLKKLRSRMVTEGDDVASQIAKSGLTGKAAEQAAKQLTDGVTTIKDLRASDLLKTRRYLSQVAGGQASLAGQLDIPMQRRAAAKMLSALDDDIEEVGSSGTAMGDALKTANGRYRAYSQRIDGVQKGPLGKLIGEDLVDAFGNEGSRIPHEQVMAGFSKLQPSELKSVRTLMKAQDPAGWQAVKRAHIQTALDKATETLGTGGAEQMPIRPARFFQELGAKTLDKKRMAEIFEPGEIEQIDELFKIGKRLGDRTGYNASGTSGMSQLMGAIGKIGSTAIEAAALRNVADVMSDPMARKAALDVARLPHTSPTAIRAGAYLTNIMGGDRPAATAAIVSGASPRQAGGDTRNNPIAVRTPQEAAAYPRGTWVMLPDGSVEVVE